VSIFSDGEYFQKIFTTITQKVIILRGGEILREDGKKLKKADRKSSKFC
jgi:hypothetical protein